MTAPARSETVIPEWSLADRLRKIRRDYAHMDQDEFAEALGVKSSRYGAWETGRNRPEDIVELARRIEEVTGVPAAWTLGVYGGLGLFDGASSRRVSSGSTRELISSSDEVNDDELAWYSFCGNLVAA